MIVSTTSVLPAPMSPASPRISPFLRVKLTFSNSFALVKFFTSRTTSPIFACCFGYISEISRSTIYLIISASVISFTRPVWIKRPSLRIVTRLQTPYTSSSLWEINTIAFPWSHNRLTVFSRYSISVWLSAEVGSSMMMTSAS